MTAAYPDPGSTVVIATGRHGFEDLDGREAQVTSWDGYRGTILLHVPPTAGERARGEFGRRIEVGRDEVERSGVAGSARPRGL